MHPTTTTRPWGSFIRFTNNELSTVKILYVHKGEETSLQYHANREEFWKILSGSPRIVIGSQSFDPKPGEEFTVEPGTQHQIAAPLDDVAILEISLGHFDEDDIVRVKDKYNRVP